EEILSSGDEVADRRDAQTFLAEYDLRHKIRLDAKSATLLVGEDDWPMPIPLVCTRTYWSFDAEGGREELQARRVGRNELSTIEVCRAIVDAQQEYAALKDNVAGEYAAKFLSDPGQHNGLYWETRADEAPSPLGDLVAAAVQEGYPAA